MAKLAGRLQLSEAQVDGLLDHNPRSVIERIEEVIRAETGRVVDLVVPELPSEAGSDFNRDGVTDSVAGDHVLILAPDVRLDALQASELGESDAVQRGLSTQIFNRFGQIVAQTDPEGNTTQFVYYSALNPSGQQGGGAEVGVFDADFNLPDLREPAVVQAYEDLRQDSGGYLAQVVTDTNLPGGATPIQGRSGPAFTNLRESYQYNLRGATVSILDGKDQETQIELNELDQPVVVTSRAPYFFQTRYRYDANDNVVATFVEDRRAVTSSVTGGALIDGQHNVAMERGDRRYFVFRTIYNVLDEPIEDIEDSAEEGRDLAFVDGVRDLVTVYTRDANQNVTEITLPEGNRLEYTYDARDLRVLRRSGLAALNDPLDPTEESIHTFTHDANQSPITVVDAEGGDETRTEYDGYGRVKRVVDALGNTTEYTYDALGNKILISQFGQVEQGVGGNVLLAQATVRYDERGRANLSGQRRFVAGATPTDLPDVLGPTLSDGDAFVSGNMIYDRASRLVASVDDDLDTSRVSYDGANRPILSVDSEGNRVRTRYDANSNVVEVVEEDLDTEGRLRVERIVSAVFYDTLDRPTRFVDSLGNESQVGYDSRGNTTHSVDALGNVSRSDYDGLNRLVRSVSDLKSGGKGRGASLDTSNPSNADGQIRNAFRYDDNSNLIALIDDLGNRTSFDFDAHDRQIRVIQPNGSVHRTYFDRDHNVTRTVDPNGTSIGYTYDSLNRLTELQVTPAQAVQADDSPTNDPSGALNTTTVQVLGTTLQTFAYDGLSRVLRATDDNGSGGEDDSVCEIEYDSLSRVLQETQTIGSETRSIGYTWAFANEQVGLRYPNGREITHRYDRLDRLTEIADSTGALSRYRYLGVRREVECVQGNGVRHTNLNDAGDRDTGYDRLRRETERRWLRQDGSLIVGFAQGYDAVGNRRFEDKLHNKARSERWELDSAYRLVDFKRGWLGTYRKNDQVVTEFEDKTPGVSQVLDELTWSLDGEGNWKAGTRKGKDSAGQDTSSSFNREVSPTHEYTRETTANLLGGGSSATAFQYDPNGNLIRDGRLRYAWDAFNRLVEVRWDGSGAVIARYAYDAMNRRVRKEVTDQATLAELEGVTLFFCDGPQILEEVTSSDPGSEPFEVARQYVYGRRIDEPILMDRYRAGAGSTPLNTITTLSLGGSSVGVHRLYYANSSLKSVYALTEDSAAAPVVEGYEYGPYGEHSVLSPGAGNSEVLFDRGQDEARSFTPLSRAVRSEVDNPYLFTGRYFDAETGLHHYRNRYYDAVLGRFISQDPQGYGDGLNLYAYVGGNVFNATDPMGLAVQAVAAAGVALVSGGISFAAEYHRSGNLIDAAIEGGLGALEGGLSLFITPAGAGAITGFLRGFSSSLIRSSRCGTPIDLFDAFAKGGIGAMEGAITGMLGGRLGQWVGKGVKRLAKGLKLPGGTPCLTRAVASGATQVAFGSAVSMASESAQSSVSLHSNCFVKGTLVETEEGAKPIEDIEVGDKVLSRDEHTGEQGYKRVKRLFRNETQKVVTLQVKRVDAETSAQIRKGAQGRAERRSTRRRTKAGVGVQDEGGAATAEPPSAGADDDASEVQCTPGHPFWVRGQGWVYAGALQAGDLLRGAQGEVLRVLAVRVEARTAKTYNFEVEGWHTYFAEGAWVHNTSKRDRGKGRRWREFYVVGEAGLDLAEFDLVRSNMVIEQKSGTGLSHPKNMQKPEEWAEKNIYRAGKKKIHALERGVRTRDGKGRAPEFKRIKRIRHLQFHVESNSPDLRRAVHESVRELRRENPGWRITAKTGCK